MQFVSSATNHTAHVKALIEQCRRLSLRTLISFLFAYQDFNLFGEETADGRGTAGSEDFGFPEGLPIETYGHVLLSRIPRTRHDLSYHVPYV
jgi:hypothetical protein